MRKIVIPGLAALILTLLALSRSAWGQDTPPPPPPPPGFLSPTPPTLAPPAAPVTSTPTPTITPTVTPTATATATPTSTPVPLRLSVKLAHGSVAPRSKQQVRVTTLAGARVQITVKFPDGDKKVHHGVGNASGKLKWSFVQPGSRITHGSQTASVSTQASNATDTRHNTKHYTIGFAGLDVSIEPRSQKRGAAVAVWVHSYPTSALQVVMRFHDGHYQRLYGHAGKDGWMYARYAVPSSVSKGRVLVYGYGTRGKTHTSGETSFRVK